MPIFKAVIFCLILLLSSLSSYAAGGGGGGGSSGVSVPYVFPLFNILLVIVLYYLVSNRKK